MRVFLGSAGFALFFLGDLNDWKWGKKLLHAAFPMGLVLLGMATYLGMGEASAFRWGYMIATAVFLILLVYTLFFAVPISAAYVRQDKGRTVCTGGVYALCRHPGVLWFIGLYLSLWRGAALPLWDVILYCVLDLLLILFEDRWVFPACLGGYAEYQRTTPFLIPDPARIRSRKNTRQGDRTMRFDEKLRKMNKEQLWQEYCGFLDMDLTDYMYTQRRLMEEQLGLWASCALGRKLLHGKTPTTIEELREMLPLTDYADYADDLLPKREEMLCVKPTVWIHTTWEGGLRPTKVAPYTRGMLDTYRHNLLSGLMFATAKRKGDFDIHIGDRVLYGGAPLPYATGLIPSLMNEDLALVWLPEVGADNDLSFSQRIKKGFSQALSGGVDLFFGMGSVANYITENFSAGGGHSGTTHISPTNLLRYLKARSICRRDGRKLRPGDIFRLKAFFCAGTDASCYKDRLRAAWGVEPFELAAGTESTCIGSETWEHNGLVFFPNACFYEFIPEEEMQRNLRDPSYRPRTCLMDGVQTGCTYELVLSVFHGGAFMRYRIGDVYRCLSAGGNQIPRFTFVDRVPNVIDIAGFTRITASSMEEVIRLSGLRLGDWLLKKEFSADGNPFLHMYLEIPPDTQISEVVTRSVLTERLTIYFKYFDSDYSDLKKLLNIEPLQISILKYGTIAEYEQLVGERLSRINPGMLDIDGLLKLQTGTIPDPERSGVCR